jgi:putative ATP-dependent endonuclease of OLD family
MYLQRIRARNYRAFGDGKTAPELDWKLNPGMNMLVGENDAGKTGVIDAIRQILLTTTYEAVRVTEEDFHLAPAGRADVLVIEASLVDLSAEQEGAIIEWLTYEPDGSRTLTINLQAKLHPPQAKRRSRVDVLVRAGVNGTGPEIGAAVRELVRATYLRPLRDAVAELRPGRASRLSQILAAHEAMAGQEVSDFDEKAPTSVPKTLVGLMEHAQHHIGEHSTVKAVRNNINDNYLSQIAFAGDSLNSDIRLVGNSTLTSILERFELSLAPPGSIPSAERCARGLGYNNALFMATEMVLLRGGDQLGLLLIEEPEAHLHPQLQVRVMDFFEDQASKNGQPAVQVVMSTHSPTLAAGAPIEAMTLIHKGQTFRLCPEETCLAKADYAFLRRFMDATKSNLFFARGVLIVEGPAEALLLPAIADMADLSFSRYGVSVVNVGSVGLYHYARILQRRTAGATISVPVACVTDRDIVPESARSYVDAPKKGKRFEADYTAEQSKAAVQSKVDRVETTSSPNVRVFVSNHWTLEYDMARSGLGELMHCAITLAVQAKSKGERLKPEDEARAMTAAATEWAALKAKYTSVEELGSVVYQPLHEEDASKAVAAEYAAQLLRTGKYGKGQVLLDSLPPYLKQALRHLTSTSDAPPQGAAK